MMCGIEKKIKIQQERGSLRDTQVVVVGRGAAVTML
jgi:hypothetical protein